MKIALITGSAGLVGLEASQFFSDKMDAIVGVDADYRSRFFGEAHSVNPNKHWLEATIPNYSHFDRDVSRYEAVAPIFQQYTTDIQLVIHAAAQPSHDWSATDPLTDHAINATGTLNLLELTRQYCPEAVFLHTSTSKVYGTYPNSLPLKANNHRIDLPAKHPHFNGIDEAMPVDQTMRTPFGTSKLAADTAAQEYGHYFGLKTHIFRAGCITGSAHRSAEKHGFLAYLVKCARQQIPYTIYGYEGKQVRDNIHAYDLAKAFWESYQNPGRGEVYNIGGGRANSCSVLQAIELLRQQHNWELPHQLSKKAREGDHAWYITDFSKFKAAYPDWELSYGLREILHDLASERETQP
jgi:CDP-paratose 2-epimerase